MKFVEIRMINTIAAHDQNDGGVMLPVKKYEEGKEYLVSEALAGNLIISKNAEVVIGDDITNDNDNSNDIGEVNSQDHLLNIASDAASILNSI